MTVSRDLRNDDGEAVDAGQVRRLARTLTRMGYRPALADAQKQDLEVWAAVGAEMDKQAGEDGR